MHAVTSGLEGSIGLNFLGEVVVQSIRTLDIGDGIICTSGKLLAAVLTVIVSNGASLGAGRSNSILMHSTSSGVQAVNDGNGAATGLSTAILSSSSNNSSTGFLRSYLTSLINRCDRSIAAAPSHVLVGSLGRKHFNSQRSISVRRQSHTRRSNIHCRNCNRRCLDGNGSSRASSMGNLLKVFIDALFKFSCKACVLVFRNIGFRCKHKRHNSPRINFYTLASCINKAKVYITSLTV